MTSWRLGGAAERQSHFFRIEASTPLLVAAARRSCLVGRGRECGLRCVIAIALSSSGRGLAADAAGAERAGVCADFLEGVGEGFDLGVGEVLGEVSLDSVSVVAAGAVHCLGALLGEDDRIERRSCSGRTRRTSPASSILSTRRVKPLLLCRIRPASSLIGTPSGDSSRWIRTSYQRSVRPTWCSSSASSTLCSASPLSRNRRQARSRSGVGLDKDRSS